MNISNREDQFTQLSSKLSKIHFQLKITIYGIMKSFFQWKRTKEFIKMIFTLYILDNFALL